MDFAFLLSKTDNEMVEFAATLKLSDCQSLRTFAASNSRPAVVALIDAQFQERARATEFNALVAANQGKIGS